MHNRKMPAFHGQIETVWQDTLSNLDLKVKQTFKVLRIQSHLTAAGIRKWAGYPAAQLLYVLVNLVFMHIHSVGEFAHRTLVALSPAKKDAFYRFKNHDFSWRSFQWRLIGYLQQLLNWSQYSPQDSYFVIDPTPLPKRGQKMEELSWVYDHSQGKTVLGYEVLTLGLVNPQGFYPLDFGYHFSKDKGKHYRPAQPTQARSSTARRLQEARISKLDLSLKMLKKARAQGINAAYVLVDRWFTSPKFMQALRGLGLHALGRLKKDGTRYQYQGRWLTLAQLYQIKKPDLVLDKELGYQLVNVAVTCPHGLAGNIVFSKGYQEPDLTHRPGAKLSPKPAWAAFFTTDTSLSAPEVVKKYMNRWSIEVFFKEAKTRLGLGQDQSRTFTAQLCAVTLVFLRYNLLAFLRAQQAQPASIGELFRQVEQEIAPLSYLDQIRSYFRKFLLYTLEVIGQWAHSLDQFRDCITIIINSINEIPIGQECET